MDTQSTIEATLNKQDPSKTKTTITNQKQDLATNNPSTSSNNINNKTNSTTCPASPPSASSSPTHEFSFTISLHSSSSTTTTNTTAKSLFPSYNKTKTSNNNSSGNSNNSNNSFAIDLSPADDIFFHGHLLPLHFLSNLPVSPRSSTNSLDSFTLPITELLQDRKPEPDTNTTNHDKDGETTKNRRTKTSTNVKNNIKTNKPFSLFGWRKGCEDDVGDKENQQEHEEEEDMKNKEKQKKKLRFDQVSHVIKRYARMVLFFNKNRPRRENINFHRGAYSFSGSWRSSNKKPNSMMMMNRGGRRGGDYSAPASMRTSPTNSGLLVPNPTLYSSSSDHSTMEELQAAIQAAIAHCKNSINNAEDKISF